MQEFNNGSPCEIDIADGCLGSGVILFALCLLALSFVTVRATNKRKTNNAGAVSQHVMNFSCVIRQRQDLGITYMMLQRHCGDASMTGTGGHWRT